MQIHAYLGEVGPPFFSYFSWLILNTVLRDVSERGRDIEGCIKQWFAYVKPNFELYVEPQRKVAGKFIHSETAISVFKTARYHCPTRS